MKFKLKQCIFLTVRDEMKKIVNGAFFSYVFSYYYLKKMFLSIYHTKFWLLNAPSHGAVSKSDYWHRTCHKARIQSLRCEEACASSVNPTSRSFCGRHHIPLRNIIFHGILRHSVSQKTCYICCRCLSVRSRTISRRKKIE